MTKDEALKLALETLEASHFLIHGSETKGGLAFCMDGYYSGCFDIDSNDKQTNKAITAIKEALAQLEQEPRCEAIIEVFGKDWRLDYMSLPVGKHKLYTQQYTYTTPPQREPLTDEEIILIVAECAASHQHTDIHFARAIERAHGIKGLV